VSYLLRLVLPDRPGALGAVATALGTVGADILSVDVIERNADCAIDDFVVELPPDKLADTLVSAAATVEGVQVESIRPYAGQLDPHRELELLEALARDPAKSLPPASSGPAGHSSSALPWVDTARCSQPAAPHRSWTRCRCPGGHRDRPVPWTARTSGRPPTGHGLGPSSRSPRWAMRPCSSDAPRCAGYRPNSSGCSTSPRSRRR